MLRLVFVILVMIPMYANSQDSSPAGDSSAKQAVTPPVAKKIHTEKTVNGKVLTDDYAWLRERSNPDVKALLEGENAYLDRNSLEV